MDIFVDHLFFVRFCFTISLGFYDSSDLFEYLKFGIWKSLFVRVRKLSTLKSTAKLTWTEHQLNRRMSNPFVVFGTIPVASAPFGA